MTLAEARELIDRRVIYTGGHKPEVGVIRFVTEHYVFVLYEGGQHPIATGPEHLELELS